MIDSPKEYLPEYILSALHIESYEPSPSQHSKIGRLHNSIVGHFGLERTLKRFKDLKDTWEYQRQHIRYYIDHCPCCQKMNMLKIPIHAHGFTTSTYTPMECLNTDFIGPFSDQGYFLVIVDTFTRWVELYHNKMRQLYLLQSVSSNTSVVLEHLINYDRIMVLISSQKQFANFSSLLVSNTVLH